MVAVILIAAVCLAYANGANDNFKGVATLFGSGTSDYRRALTWATITTFCGSLSAIVLAEELLKRFSGGGLIDETVVSDVRFVAAVALGAGITVLSATRIGMPVSTTHALVGALAGAGWAAGSAINSEKLMGSFFLPLLVSPVLALGATCLIYPIFRFAREALGVTRRTCICIGVQTMENGPVMEPAAALQKVDLLTATVGDVVTCRDQYVGRVLGLDAASTLDRAHFLSAGTVSFARGVNDTPKIAALLLVTPHLPGSAGIVLVAMAIAVGGILSARRVAEVMSHRIAPMNHGQGFTANLATGVVVLTASRLGLPVSTTHVSCGALFGMGAFTGEARWKIIGTILLAWLFTLPAAAITAAAVHLLLSPLA